MSKIGRHAEGQASISYFAPAAHKAALQEIAAEMFPHAPKPFSTLLRKIHADFLDAYKAQRALPHTPTPTDLAALRATVAKAHHAATRDRKAKAKP